MKTRYTSNALIFILLVMILNCTKMYGFIIHVPNDLQDFAILSTGDLSTDNSIYATGKIGAGNSITGNFSASEGVESGTAPVINGINTLNQFVVDLNQLTSVQLSNILDGQVISGGGIIYPVMLY